LRRISLGCSTRVSLMMCSPGCRPTTLAGRSSIRSNVIVDTRSVTPHTPETFHDVLEIINFIIELLDSSRVGGSSNGYGLRVGVVGVVMVPNQRHDPSYT
jgi:hypothetical protein